MLRASLLAFICSLSACSFIGLTEHTDPPVLLPSKYQALTTTSHPAPEQNTSQIDPWWFAFGDLQLNELIERAFEGNLTLRGAWARLAQANATTVILGSEAFPQLQVGAGVSRTKSKITDRESLQVFRGVGEDIQNDWIAQSGLSFEVDLWRRIASQREAGRLRAEATLSDVEQTALVLAGMITDTYFTLQRQQALIDLLHEQIEVSKTFQELVELRFSLGRGSALDVYQQRQQVAALESELPKVEQGFHVAKNRLAVLLGVTPAELKGLEISGDLPLLPAFPSLVSPVDLLSSRPDLRAGRLRLQAAAFDVSSAIAERFPSLLLGFTYDFRTADLSDLFTTKIGTISSNFLLPLVDGGRRRANVRVQEGIEEEFLANYGQLYLEALEEVENSILQEHFQSKLVEKRDVQHDLAQATLRESRSRYLNGLTDYVDVLLAIGALQTLERQRVAEQTDLLFARSQLYRALGGPLWSKERENLSTPGASL